MTTNKRNALIAFAILFVLALVSILNMDVGTLRINGENFNASSGILSFLVAGLFIFIGIFFAISLTGVMLVLAAVVLVMVLLAVVGSIVLAFLPLILPILIIIGIISLFTRRPSATASSSSAQ